MARFIVRHLHRPLPLPLVIQSWLWLAANTNHIRQKRRVDTEPRLDAGNEAATRAAMMLETLRRYALAPDRLLIMPGR
jgi:hypothetical protein